MTTTYNHQRSAKYFGLQGCKFGSVCILCGVIDEWPKWHQAALASSGPKIVDPEFYYFAAERLFGLIRGGTWTETQLKPDDPYVCLAGEFEIQHWRKWMGPPAPEDEKPDDSPKWAFHYVAGDGAGRVLRDPWPGSRTLVDGDCRGRLIYRRIS